MYCSSCGRRIPSGRSECAECTDRRFDSAIAAQFTPDLSSPPQVSLTPVRTCPRCGYRGEGLPYFDRGGHMFGLVAATFFTLPFAFGAGGLLYYGLRREHRVCPRCGHGWGRRAAGASIVTAARPAPVHATAAGGPISSGGYEGVLRGWSIVMAVVGAILVVAGAIEAELLLLVLGVLCGLGAVGLHRSANRARNRRRDAILATLQMHVLKLARERAGRLTVTEVAASLGWPMRRADKVLQSLDDGWRVDSAVTDEGVIVYEFLELVHARKPLPPTPSADEESDGYPRASSG